MSRELALHAHDPGTRFALREAAERVGLSVVELTDDPQSLLDPARDGAVFRAPGGLVQAAGSAGAKIELVGPTPTWFIGLDPAVVGRHWSLVNPSQARDWLGDSAVFIKLADAKLRALPARRYRDVAEFDAAMARVRESPDLQLLATTGWLDLDSEYRVFTADRSVLACSAYRVQDDPWHPLLHQHRASFHAAAAEWSQQLLTELAPGAVPPSAALDVARLTNGQFILLEANQSWSAALYGCAADRVLTSVLAANRAPYDEASARWLWTPDPAVAHTAR